VGWSRTCRHRCPGRAVRRGRGALDHLWDRRTECDPVLIVVDEAHKVCSAKPGDPLQALATERLVQITAEDGSTGCGCCLRPSSRARSIPGPGPTGRDFRWCASPDAGSIPRLPAGGDAAAWGVRRGSGAGHHRTTDHRRGVPPTCPHLCLDLATAMAVGIAGMPDEGSDPQSAISLPCAARAQITKTSIAMMANDQKG
jgi:hypothetical protein